MKRIFTYLILGFIFFVLGYYMMIYYIPQIVVSRLTQGMEEQGVENNSFRHSPLIDATSRIVVRPNPDFIYSICRYDLSEGPLEFEGRIPDSTYWSIAFYQDNTVNYYVKNDQQFKNKQLSFSLYHESAKPEKSSETTENIASPTKKGIILTRFLLPNREEATIKAFQKLQESFRVKIP